MRTENDIDRLRSQEPPWDEVREHRVYSKAREELRRSGRPRDRRRTVFLGTAAGLALAGSFVAVALYFSVDSPPSTTSPSNTTTVRHEPSKRTVAKQRSEKKLPSTLVLRDAGHATLMPGAHISVLTQNKRLLELEQTTGQARYKIERAPNREVLVHAAGVKIRVVGTVFTISIEGETVAVDVKKGVVNVDDGTRQINLSSGENIAVTGPRHRRETLLEERTILTPPANAKRLTQRPALPVHRTEDMHREESDDEQPTSTRQRGLSSQSELFAEVDAARHRGDFDEAATLLRRIVSSGGGDAILASAQFMLGRVERARKRPRIAARAYTKCYSISPNGALAEDARAEEAASWAAAKDHDRARAAANAYLQKYPRGIHAARMSRLAE